jgi:hypothetical protein
VLACCYDILACYFLLTCIHEYDLNDYVLGYPSNPRVDDMMNELHRKIDMSAACVLHSVGFHVGRTWRRKGVMYRWMAAKTRFKLLSRHSTSSLGICIEYRRVFISQVCALWHLGVFHGIGVFLSLRLLLHSLFHVLTRGEASS